VAETIIHSIPVLMYHALEDVDHPAVSRDAGEQRYVLQVDKFCEQMEYLSQNGYKTLLLDELLAVPEWPEKAVILTFDDGHESNATLALPILQDYDFKAEFFVTTDWIGAPHYMSTEQILTLYHAGMGIGSHGVTHIFFDNLDINDMQQELLLSKNRLSTIINVPISSIALPGGRTHKDIESRAREINFKAIFTSMPGLLFRGCSLYQIPRIPIYGNTNLSAFESIVSADMKYYSKIQRRNVLLMALKSMLGNRLYVNIRKFLLN